MNNIVKTMNDKTAPSALLNLASLNSEKSRTDRRPENDVAVALLTVLVENKNVGGDKPTSSKLTETKTASNMLLRS